MSTHNICFRGEIRKIFTGYPSLTRPLLIYGRHCLFYVFTHVFNFLVDCATGSYGSQCEYVCGHCKDGSCNRDNGTCGMFDGSQH